MKTVYLSIACLDRDEELMQTIKSAKDNASVPDSINIGIAFIGNKEFYDSIVEKINIYGYKNIKHAFYPLRKNLGVGRGRHLAQSMYAGEDYFLQIDAHTFFDYGWDNFIKERFDTISKAVNNQKTIVSGYPGRYGYFDDYANEKFWTKDNFNYPKYIKEKYIIHSKHIPAWSDFKPNDISKDLKNMIDEHGFAPITKVSAAFILGNKYFAEDICTEAGSLFWEEEIIQSVNLIDKGFTLTYAGEKMPVHHFYLYDKVDNKGSRSSLSDFTEKDLNYRMIDSYYTFIDNPKNYNKVKKYEEYANMSLKYGPVDENSWSRHFANIGYIPYA